jgi:RNA-directed DNA polymerase
MPGSQEQQAPHSVSTKLQRIATMAREAKDMSFTSLAHHIDIEWLREAYRRTRKDGAVGVDGQTASEYEAELESNLQSLLERAKSGTYRAPPVRRVEIPKGSGKETRPIGIPTFEDKVLQRAVAMVLEAVYEQDFRDCSYGFRPGRSAHQALESLWQQTMKMGGGWVIEVDIRKFFDTLDHVCLRGLLDIRVRDGVLLRLIGKWLKAGVLDGGNLSYPTQGTPQGGVISPMLANIYLHEVLDVWFEDEMKLELHGEAYLCRYADDFVIVLSDEVDARWVMSQLPERFGSYGLTLHPEKTRLIPFGRPSDEDDQGPGSFDLLGFTHYWGRSQKGNPVVKRKTAKGRFGRALKRISEWCRKVRHRPIPEQHKELSKKMKGHYGYYGITGNSGALNRFFNEVERIWRKWLGTRSRHAHRSWLWFRGLLQRHPLPPPIAVHSKLRRAANL